MSAGVPALGSLVAADRLVELAGWSSKWQKVGFLENDLLTAEEEDRLSTPMGRASLSNDWLAVLRRSIMLQILLPVLTWSSSSKTGHGLLSRYFDLM
eukprot:CAMPEP_0119112622 /NCGR_PEP_ID=MMETSP1180-20130426/40997_1 /TAXON_ID=3052 ORGANISM="Chlamydomonas cf sp, Strain CCMP681" /NCGR_SAMPLE_ID=MMETSP1180 /ASSEMBLY_ACC=CAM_ASM_000741 /LENGTH=96 /DNA_ID=CAMNT_0007100207 /DNA_START=2690 /DNA_END=2980 /DNA_ORIENTATION=-